MNINYRPYHSLNQPERISPLTFQFLNDPITPFGLPLSPMSHSPKWGSLKHMPASVRRDSIYRVPRRAGRRGAWRSGSEARSFAPAHGGCRRSPCRRLGGVAVRPAPSHPVCLPPPVSDTRPNVSCLKSQMSQVSNIQKCLNVPISHSSYMSLMSPMCSPLNVSNIQMSPMSQVPNLAHNTSKVPQQQRDASDVPMSQTPQIKQCHRLSSGPYSSVKLD